MGLVTGRRRWFLEVVPGLVAGAIGLVMLLPETVPGQEAVADPPAITASGALAQVGKRARVELVVESSRLMADRRACFLNSMKNHRDAGNFTVVIFRDGLARFAEAGIDDPAAHFSGRTIRVRGLVAERDGRPQIVVETPDQIEVVAVSPSSRGS
jgi:hypothetical protein